MIETDPMMTDPVTASRLQPPPHVTVKGVRYVRDTTPQPLTVGELRDIIANLPSDMPVDVPSPIADTVRTATQVLIYGDGKGLCIRGDERERKLDLREAEQAVLTRAIGADLGWMLKQRG